MVSLAKRLQIQVHATVRVTTQVSFACYLENYHELVYGRQKTAVKEESLCNKSNR
jgi:hypothetical protein